MNRLLRFLVVVTLFSLATVSSRAQVTTGGLGSGEVSLSAVNTVFTELFTALASSGTTGSTLPVGWYTFEAGGTGQATYGVSDGAANAGNTYSFGSTGSPDRALGGLFSGTVNPTIGAAFKNDTGLTITQLEIAYDGEQWRAGAAGRSDRIDFQYSLDATTLGTGTWTDVNALDFSSAPAPAAGPINGNASPTPIAGVISGLSIAPGQTIRIRWTDSDVTPGADDGLGVDNFTIVARGVADALPSLSVSDASVTEGNSGTTTATFNVTLSSSDHDGVTFTIQTADGTATSADADYQPRSETVTIPDGSASFAFDVVVNGDLTFESHETFSVTVSGATGATVVDGTGVGTITNDDAAPPVVTDVVISQIYGSGGNAGSNYTHDFIELFNQSSSVIDLAGWSVQYASAGGTSWQVTPLSGTIAPGGYYLVREAPATGTTIPAADANGTIAMSGTAGKIALSTTAAAFTGACPLGAVDLVGYGTSASCFEGSGPAAAPSTTTAALRKRGGCFDSDNNNVDFATGAPSPRNTASPINTCTFTTAAIHDIQGTGLASPYAGQDVITEGIVTARKSNGFFLQTPDAAVDSNGSTSEAIFVFTTNTPPTAVAVGDAVTVRGTVSEFFQLTQIESSLAGDITVTASNVPLPLAVTLTTLHLNPAGPTTQLEPLEGMRVFAASLTSVAPTDEFGEIGTVLTGVARPMREAGVSVLQPVPPDPTSGVVEPTIPRFDENPERLFVDTEGLVGQPVVVVTSNTVLGPVSGPLDFSFSRYKVLPENTLTPGAGMNGVAVRAANAGEFTIAGFNIENFTGAETQKRKASLAIRQLMRLPDVIGHIEIGGQAVLQSLADQVNADEMAEGRPNPAYVAELRTASGTQHLGFLVKTSRVRIDEVAQEPAGDFMGGPLHDRPPLVLRATVDPAGLNPRAVIVVLNHTRSFIDIELLDAAGARVRLKRRLQAESIADLLQSLQTSNPGVLVTTIGDFNAYQFSDGYTDPIGTLKGAPTADEFIVEDGSADVVNPNFINLTDSLPADQQYSFLFEGTPQALDHMLVNSTGAAWVTGYQVTRANSDFPDAFANDPDSPLKSSDHDMPVAYYTFPAPSTDLSVVKAANAASVTVGQTVTFTVTVTNNGTAPAQNVVVADHLPAGLTRTSCTASGGGVCGGTTTTPNATFALLPAGASETVTIVATAGCGVPNGAALTNIATVTSSTADPNTTNNTASAGVTAVNAPPTISNARADRNFLLPLHLLVPVEIAYNATDACGAVTTTLTVTSNEPVTGTLRQQGLAGLTSPDWVVVNNHLVLLRGEKAEKGNGRVYTITITATDAAGGKSTQQVTVRVPKSLLEIIFD